MESGRRRGAGGLAVRPGDGIAAGESSAPFKAGPPCGRIRSLGKPLRGGSGSCGRIRSLGKPLRGGSGSCGRIRSLGKPGRRGSGSCGRIRSLGKPLRGGSGAASHGNAAYRRPADRDCGDGRRFFAETSVSDIFPDQAGAVYFPDGCGAPDGCPV